MSTSVIARCPCCGDPEPGFVWFAHGPDSWVAPCPECHEEGVLEFTPGELDVVVNVMHPEFGHGTLCQASPVGSLFFVQDGHARVVNRRELDVPFTYVPQPMVKPLAVLEDVA